MQVTTIGLDIAKNVFQVHGIDAAEKVVIRKQLRRGQVLKFFASLPPCLIGMEACATAHYWARELTKLGHEVRLMPAKDVKAYDKVSLRASAGIAKNSKRKEHPRPVRVRQSLEKISLAKLEKIARVVIAALLRRPRVPVALSCQRALRSHMPPFAKSKRATIPRPDRKTSRG